MYYVIETQTNGETGAGIINFYTSRAQAEQQYHIILAAAAVSNVDQHGAILASADYRYIKRSIYDKTNPENNLDDE